MAMSDIDEAGPPGWLRVADYPLIALVMAVLLYALASKLGHELGETLPPLGQPSDAAVHMLVMLVFVLPIYKFAISRLGETPRDDLSWARALPELVKGVAAGTLLFCLVVGIAATFGAYRITGRDPAPDLMLPLITTAIMPAFMEELLFRGILFRWIEEFGGTWAGLIISSALFGLVHSQNPGATWFSSFAVAVEGGLLLGGAYMLTRSLWMPIGLHAAWNFTQGPILGVPVSGNQIHGIFQAKLSGPVILSGGPFGLEASVIAIVVCTAAGLWFIWLAVKRGAQVRPWWVRRRAVPSS
jgi:membrane protease YdiL (CAAX protease family)